MARIIEAASSPIGALRRVVSQMVTTSGTLSATGFLRLGGRL
jgi:hypothetical protein